ncbi:carbamate kinase [Bacillus wiedmannii]|uniref:Carbamate kinase n=1 Tax=Bacillus wiedmannii TaxID=1890302 RepID=A0A2A7J3L2_9BACI|nr:MULTISPECIES: carbamate kinase [Bacillus cereus group]AZJ24213.1 carbamate kinase [Bacillus wiedmannii bv. thuringiensis]KAA0767685.1 carbamate kinase [Bacillus sp. AR2-1]MCU5500923.1 carbamate kinase [Bacillus wiedmannii]MCU5685331.1 carbamate kinase [Bacillus wiedmannii]MED3612035.1 carbamate kinase [Bacillus wiedmannii]
MKRKKIVVALGGNAIQSGDATAQAQQEALERTAEQLTKIMENDVDIVIAHGNGPQVGNILLQQKVAETEKTPAMPLDTCGAMSQGMIGYWMENAIEKALKKRKIKKDVATVITRVIVDEKDEAFENPTKPIGPFYTEEEARKLMEETKAVFKEDAGRGWRRVVPSPKPVSIHEHKIINSLVEDGDIVIAVGGGGIPVIESEEGLKGIEAVIDKDFAAQKLAELVDADTLVILTAVDHVYLNFNKTNQKKLEAVTVDELEQYIRDNQFAAGSMLPKIQAAINFANTDPKRKTIITSLEKVYEALEENTGTIISKHDACVYI